MLPAYEIRTAMESLNIALQLAGKKIDIGATVVSPTKIIILCRCPRHSFAYSIHVFGGHFCSCYMKNFPDSNKEVYEGAVSGLYDQLTEHIRNEYKRSLH